MDIRSGTAVSGDVKLYYEDMGDLDHPPVLLIMGLGAQMLLWRTDFCARLVAKGLRVIRYDNRDVGLSTKTERHRPGQPLATRLVRSWLGLPSQAAYTLEDMAADAAALLDHLDVKHAHVVGASMGGMIAQIFAARFAQRTKTLAVIFSSNNHRFLPPPAPRALLALLTGPPPDSPRDVIVDNAVRVSKIIGSPAYPIPEDQVRAEAAESYDRNFHPWGNRPAVQRDTGQRQPAALRPAHRRTDRRHPRARGQADAAVRRPRGRASNQRRAPGAHRRHGP